MKKTLVALAVMGASASAFAGITGDQFSVSGSLGLGGYYDTGSKEFADDWVTGVHLNINYENGNVVGFVDLDLEGNITSDEEVTGVENQWNSDLDKAWIGYKTDFGTASYGIENDTALDKVDGKGDYTYEFGSSASDASDAFNVFKFQGKKSGVVYGVSHFQTDVNNTGDYGYNGYVGFESDSFNVYAGYEDRQRTDYTVTTVSGNVKISDAVSVGANLWIDEVGTAEETGAYLSGKFSVNEKTTLAAGYKTETDSAPGTADVDNSYFNVAASYEVDNLEFGLDIKRDLEVAKGSEEETYVFAAAWYKF